MIRINVPFYFELRDSFQLKPLIVRDRLGTEIWFLNLYIALNITKGEASHEHTSEHLGSGQDQQN